MNDPDHSDQQPQVPQSGPDVEPEFEETDPPAPEVVDPPGRSTEF